MRTNKEYMIREIAGEKILIPTGAASQKLNGMIRLTDTAAFIWEQIDTAKDLAEIVERLCGTFEVDEQTAQRDVHGFVYELYIRDIVLDIPELALEVKEKGNLG